MKEDLAALKREKSSELIKLELLKKEKEPSRRKIRDLANKVASLEGEIAYSLISKNNWARACVNLISQASCLKDAGRKVEAQRVLTRALEFCGEASLERWISDELATLALHDFKIFLNAKVQIDNNKLLRDPQRFAYRAAAEYFESKTGPAIIQLPVGCGKTGTMAILPFKVSPGRVLVVVPNLEIRGGVHEALDVTQPGNFWEKTGVFLNGRTPVTAVLDPDANVHDCDEADILVANIQQLTSKSGKWLEKFGPDYFSMVLVDEAHHSPATTWQKTLSRFPAAKVASFTATPLRSDGKEIEGDRIFRYPISKAIREGYIKDIATRRLEPTELYFTYKGDERRHSAEEVAKLKETTWFSRGVAMSRECNAHIVDASIQSMRKLREEGTEKHQIIAAACSIDHAKSIRSLYSERGVKAAVLHSNMDDASQDRVRSQLRNLQLDVVVQVSMLGEGADYPNLSVAAIFRPFRHIVPYVQFVGRVMRVLKQNAPGDPDNRAFVISHVGLNVDRWWDELKVLDEDDQQLWLELANGVRSFENTDERRPRQFKPPMEVVSETLESIYERHYLGKPLTAEDNELIIDDLLNSMRMQGIDPDELGVTRAKLRSQLNADEPEETVVPFVPSKVQPQEARKQARKRLAERSKSAAKELLDRLGLAVTGRQLLPHVNFTSQNNLGAAIRLMHSAVNDFLEIESDDREHLSRAELEKAYNAIDEIIERVAEEIGES